ncbi:MAG: hypothetical protein AVO38_15770 [delta proteobacterium ML8_D]|nr:MAG: hypothetical protein AVO38_15770 [delta proteobacterium ML8_D]
MLILSKTKFIFFIPLSALLVFTFSAIWLNSEYSSAFRTDLKHLILDELIDINPLPTGTKVDAIYILGGSQTSLEAKYKTASDLYQKGICKRIWILSRPGKTEYSVSLDRNLTNNEWSVLKFAEFGVPPECIEPIKIDEGFFGTFTEAKGISSLMKKQGHKSLLLISSPYHTHRLKISFDKFLQNHHVALYVQESDGHALLRDLLVEFAKLKVYQYLL